MGLVPLEALLWRRLNKAAFDTLSGESRGQYDIRLTRLPEVASFFDGLPRRDITNLGGYNVDVPIEPYDGVDPVEAMILEVRYMGPKSQRGDWYVRAQRPGSAYPLWRLGRGFPASFDPKRRDFILILRDTNGKFHARTVREETFMNLPSLIQPALQSEEVGVVKWTE